RRSSGVPPVHPTVPHRPCCPLPLSKVTEHPPGSTHKNISRIQPITCVRERGRPVSILEAENKETAMTRSMKKFWLAYVALTTGFVVGGESSQQPPKPPPPQNQSQSDQKKNCPPRPNDQSGHGGQPGQPPPPPPPLGVDEFFQHFDTNQDGV